MFGGFLFFLLLFSLRSTVFFDEQKQQIVAKMLQRVCKMQIYSTIRMYNTHTHTHTSRNSVAHSKQIRWIMKLKVPCIGFYKEPTKICSIWICVYLLCYPHTMWIKYIELSGSWNEIKVWNRGKRWIYLWERDTKSSILIQHFWSIENSLNTHVEKLFFLCCCCWLLL